MNRISTFLDRQWHQWQRHRLRRRLAGHGAGTGAASVDFSGQSPQLEIWGELQLGEQVMFRSIVRPITVHVGVGATLRIGPYSYINQGTNLSAARGIALGRRCLVGENVTIFDSNYHEVDEGAGVFSAPIVIGDNVWIAQGAIILPGTRLGDHSVVAAGAVVRGEFPARSLVGGVPARLLRPIRCGDDFFRK